MRENGFNMLSWVNVAKALSGELFTRIEMFFFVFFFFLREREREKLSTLARIADQ